MRLATVDGACTLISPARRVERVICYDDCTGNGTSGCSGFPFASARQKKPDFPETLLLMSLSKGNRSARLNPFETGGRAWSLSIYGRKIRERRLCVGARLPKYDTCERIMPALLCKK